MSLVVGVVASLLVVTALFGVDALLGVVLAALLVAALFGGDPPRPA